MRGLTAIRTIYLTVLVGLSLSACGDDSSSSSGVAIENGTYQITGLVCADTGEAPDFSTATNGAAAPASLRAFNDLTTHTVTITDTAVTEVAEDADCKMTVEQTVLSNKDGKIQLALATSYTWEPSDCTFSVTYNDQEIPVGSDFGEGKIYVDSDSSSPGPALTIAEGTESGTKTATTIPLGGLGCGEQGKFQFIWK